MGNPPFTRLFVFIVAMVLATCAFGIVICLKTDSTVAMTFAMFVPFGIGTTLILRWWIPANRAVGIPTDNPTPSQWARIALSLASLAAVVALEYGIFAVTHSRIVEAAIALIGILPIGLVLLPASYRAYRAPLATETSSWRMNYILQIVLVPLFAFLTVTTLQWGVKHALDPLQNFNIAMFSRCSRYRRSRYRRCVAAIFKRKRSEIPSRPTAGRPTTTSSRATGSSPGTHFACARRRERRSA